MSFYVYIIQSEVDGSYYKGFTENPELRLDRHNNGDTVSTRHKRPWRLVFMQLCSTKKEALIRERSIKSFNRQKVEALIQSEKNLMNE